ncbi:hypothetical protein BH10ACI1_BH10ACI1_25490 [soil metagenome]
MKKINLTIIIVAAAVLIIAVAVYAQQKTDKTADKSNSHEDCPMMQKNESQTTKTDADTKSNSTEHQEMVMKNGETEMGFSQTATSHHFLLMKDGGAIQITVNDAKDTENRDKIRKHLTEIAQAFKNGIFTTPFAIHGQIPPGVPVMDQLKDKIQYQYEETENGARIRISTDNPQALTAIYDFLKFQIEEHQTGDPTSLGN